jgi:hypothetical protein
MEPSSKVNKEIRNIDLFNAGVSGAVFCPLMLVLTGNYMVACFLSGLFSLLVVSALRNLRIWVEEFFNKGSNNDHSK